MLNSPPLQSFAAVHAFYGGALTMFLAYGDPSPFDDVIRGLKEGGGGWALLLSPGDEALFGLAFDLRRPEVAEVDAKYNSDEYRLTVQTLSPRGVFVNFCIFFQADSSSQLEGDPIETEDGEEQRPLCFQVRNPPNFPLPTIR